MSAHGQHTSAYVSIRQHTVSIRQHTSAYISIRSAYVSIRQHKSDLMSASSQRGQAARACRHPRPPPSCSAPACGPTTPALAAYVSIRQHTSAYVSIREHTPAYVRIRRQHTSSAQTAAYGSIRQHTSVPGKHTTPAAAAAASATPAEPTAAGPHPPVPPAVRISHMSKRLLLLHAPASNPEAENRG